MNQLANGETPDTAVATDGNRLRTTLPESADETPLPAAAAEETKDASALKRAEQLEDQIASKVAALASSWSQRIVQLAAHVREAAEDVWAEAQSIRRGEKS